MERISITSDTPITSGQFGRLELEIIASAHGSVARRALACPPLQLSRMRHDCPFWPDAAAFTVLHLGGVLDGDRYKVDVTLMEGATGYLTSAAATLAHPAPQQPAQLDLRICLGPRARLAYLPLPLILFRDADLVQHTQVTLAPGSFALLADVVVLGRLARGERQQFRRYQSRLEACDTTGRLLMAERTDLHPAHRPLNALGLMGNAGAVGSLYLFAPGRVLDSLEAQLWQALEISGCDGAVGRLPNHVGLLVRVLGAEGSAIWNDLAALAMLAAGEGGGL